MDFKIEKILKLANITVDSDSKDKIEKDFSSILNYFETLGEVNTDNVKPLYHSIENTNNSLRDDKVRAKTNRDKILELVPQKEGFFVKVKRILYGE